MRRAELRWRHDGHERIGLRIEQHGADALIDPVRGQLAPHAVGPEGALRRYGTGSRPSYDRTRT